MRQDRVFRLITTGDIMPLTKSRPFRFVYTGANDNASNMAIDEAVMTGLRQESSTPLLRIYRWDPPTITIGYFQSIKEIDVQRCREDRIGLVRRLTGGRAVLHHQELTYSILFTEQDFQPFYKKDIFLIIARSLVDSLRQLDIASRIAAKTRGNLKSANCFASPAQFEVESLMEGKLIGSAQVIHGGVMLQHGAIPITDSYTTISRYLRCDAQFEKQASSLNKIAGREIGEHELLDALKRGFAEHFQLAEGELTDHEREMSRRLATEKYGTDEWNMRR
jgi:lipoate-protein ligase A